MKKVFILFATLILTIGCKGPQVQDLLDSINETSGYFNAELIKEETLTDGYIVIKWNYIDPCCSYNIGTQYAAVNFALFEKGMSWEEFLNASALHNIEMGYTEDFPTDQTYGSINGRPETFINIEYDARNNTWTGGLYNGEEFTGFVFEQTEAHSKDLEKIAALDEALRLNNVTKTLVGKFGLSESRAQKIAKMTVGLNKIAQKRALTDADKSHFSQEVFGLGAAAVEKAITDERIFGETENYDALIEKASELNGLSTEHTRALIEDIF